MDIDSYIYDAIFSEDEKAQYFYELIWENFKETGFAVTDESGYEIDAVVKAVALQKLLGEFQYRLYDVVNETEFEDVIEYCENLDFHEEEILEYCKAIPQIETDENDFGLSVKNLLDYTAEITADKMLEEFSADDIFDYMFVASYDFEQDFLFSFEDVDEFTAFVDSQCEKLDDYKEEYPAVMNWIEAGMLC